MCRLNGTLTRNKLLVAVVCILLVVATGAAVVLWRSSIWPRWPAPPDPTAYATTIDKALASYETDARDKTTYRPPYDPAGDYLGFSSMRWTEVENRTFDDLGFPMMLYGRRFEYNPINVAQYALSQHGKGDHPRFLAAAAFLRDELMGEDGGLRFAYRYRHYVETLEPGWTSAMAQGQALSVFSRAYRLDPDPRWLSAGSAALTYLLSGEHGLTPSLEALDPSLKDRHFFAEWPIDPPDYTLNGAMFTMLGLYDWSTVGPESESKRRADRAWRESLETLLLMLPYYDMGTITAYDLTYLTHPDRDPHIIAKYHGVHGYLLHALTSITGDDRIRSWMDRWDAYLP